MKLLIKNGHVIDPINKIDKIADILIEDGIIGQVSEHIPAAAEQIIDAVGLLVFPGLIDMHTHLREPGYEYKENILTGSRAAAAGGFTAIACMPNTHPVNDTPAVTTFIQHKAKEAGLCDVYPIAAITKGLKGEELSEMGELAECGAVAFSDDGNPVSNNRMMRLALTYAMNFDALIISHCEDRQLAENGVMNESYTSTILGLKGIPAAAEELMVAREIMLADMLKTRVHIAHVSTKGSVELIRNAKAKGIAVTCETCPHYFAATEDMVKTYDTNTKVNPPLRAEADRQAIIAGLQDGTIDSIVTDHAPHHIDEKAVEYNIALNGISGLETSFSLAYDTLVKTGALTMTELITKMSARPAQILRIPGGSLSAGATANIILADPDKEYTIDRESFYSKGRNTPFHGRKVTGKIVTTIYKGISVYTDGKVLR